MAAALAVKIEPKGEWLNETQIGKKLGLHRQTVAARLEDLGYEPDEDRSTAKLKIYWFDDEMEFALKAAKDSLSAVKIRDIRAAAELKELKLAEARGELVPMGEVIEIVQKIVSKMYLEFTVHQPKRIGPKLAKAKNIAAVKLTVKADTDKIMKSLRDNFQKFID